MPSRSREQVQGSILVGGHFGTPHANDKIPSLHHLEDQTDSGIDKAFGKDQ